MKADRINIALAVMLFLLLALCLHQSLAIKRLQFVLNGRNIVNRLTDTDALAARARSMTGDGQSEVSLPGQINGGTGESPSSDAAEAEKGETFSSQENDDKKGKAAQVGGEGKDTPTLTDDKGNPLIAAGNLAATTSAGNSSGTNTSGKKDNQKKRQPQNAVNTPQSMRLLSQSLELAKTGDYAAAQEMLRQSLEQDVTNSQAWRHMALMQRKQGLTDSEIDVCAQWMEAVPGDAAPYYLLAETYARLGMDADARQYLSEYELRGGENVSVYLQAASLYRQLQEPLEEGRVLEAWMAATPDSLQAREIWANYQRRQGNLDIALSEYEQLVSRMPGNPLPHQYMGDIYRQMNDYVNAQAEYEAAISMRPGDTNLLGRLAETQYRTGDLYGAIDSYNQIIAREPGSQAAEYARRRIETFTQ